MADNRTRDGEGGRRDCVLLVDNTLTRRAFCRKVGRCVVVAGAVELVSLVPFLTGCETGDTTTTTSTAPTTTTELPTTTTSADPVDCIESTDCVIVCTDQCTDCTEGIDCTVDCTDLCTDCTDSCVDYCTDCTDSCTDYCTDCTKTCTDACTECTDACTDSCTENTGSTECDYCTGGCVMCTACNTPNIGGLCSMCVQGTY